MTARPPVLREDLVDHLRQWLAAAGPDSRRPLVPLLRQRALRAAGRPLRRVMLRLVDPSIRDALDQLRTETAGFGRGGSLQEHPEVVVMRAELRATHSAVVELGQRLDAVERALEDVTRLPQAKPPFV